MNLETVTKVGMAAAGRGAEVLRGQFGKILNIQKKNITRFSHCLKAARGIRRLGSAVLDLCFVACGRFDGYWEKNLKPWDTAAGLLIATEAGARVTDFSDRAYKIDDNEILATNRQIHGEMIALLAIEGKI
ncbi:MAG: hypothetical protein JRI38_00745 [Deltaproteobacteria bacterium]|nr:hypothetical protein [Deltaproteobacteria bacterium]